MSRSGDGTGRQPWGCILLVAVLVLFGVFQCSTANDIDDGPSPEPASRSDEPSPEPSSSPAATIDPVTPPDLPEEPDFPEEEEEEAKEDDTDGTGEQDSDVQVGIQFGSACSPVGALGIAEDGRPAKCFMGRNGQARWGYDSNRG